MPKIAICFLLGVLLLAGCASVPKSDLAGKLESAPLVASTEDALQHPFFEEGGWPSEKWWEVFQDPQLSALIERALQNNYNLQQARSRTENVWQLTNAARSFLFPNLYGNYVEQWQHLSKNGLYRDFFPSTMSIPPTLNLLDLTLNFSYELDLWGKYRDLFHAAIGRAQAMAAEQKQAELVAAALVAVGYFDLQTKLIQKGIMLETLEQRKDLQSLHTSLSSKGVENVLPPLSSNREIHAIQQVLLFLDQGIEQDMHVLSYLVGVGPDEMVVEQIAQATFDRPFPLPANISSDLLARRPDLTAQLWRVEAAAKEIGAAKADFYPNVNLGAFGGLEALEFGKLFQWQSRMGGLTPSIHLPIFTAGKLKANLRSRVAIFNEAVYAYNDLILNAAKEVADQITTVRTINGVCDEERAALDDAYKQYEVQLLRYSKGVDNYLSVLTQEDQVLTERFKLSGLCRDRLVAIVLLIKSLGGGYGE